MQELRQLSSSALALLSLESTRGFFHLPNICWDQAAASNHLCVYPGHRAGVGKERQLQCSSSPCCLCAFMHIPTSCCHRVKDVPGDGGSLWEELDQGLMLLGMRFGTNTVFSPAVALSALGCGVLTQFCSSECLLEGQINLWKLIATMRE